MTANWQDIERWLGRAKQEKATHMLVICDTFDYEDYPVYISEVEDVREAYESYRKKSMQKVIEVYNMSMNVYEQLNENPVWNF